MFYGAFLAWKNRGQHRRPPTLSSPDSRCDRQTHRHADPGKAKTYTKLKMIELRVLGTRGVKWVQQQVRAAEARPLGAWPEPPAPVGEKWEPGAPCDEAEVCRLNPTPGSDSIAP